MVCLSYFGPDEDYYLIRDGVMALGKAIGSRAIAVRINSTTGPNYKSWKMEVPEAKSGEFLFALKGIRNVGVVPTPSPENESLA